MSSVRQLGVRFVQDRLQTLLCPENNGSGPSAEKKLRSCSPKLPIDLWKMKWVHLVICTAFWSCSAVPELMHSHYDQPRSRKRNNLSKRKQKSKWETRFSFQESRSNSWTAAETSIINTGDEPTGQNEPMKLWKNEGKPPKSEAWSYGNQQKWGQT